MYRLVRCPKCASSSMHRLPDVSAQEAARLRAAGDDSMVMVKCPQCQAKIWMPRWSLPDLPGPP